MHRTRLSDSLMKCRRMSRPWRQRSRSVDVFQSAEGRAGAETRPPLTSSHPHLMAIPTAIAAMDSSAMTKRKMRKWVTPLRRCAMK